MRITVVGASKGTGAEVVREPEAVRRAVAGADAVIVTLGGPSGADGVR